MPGILRHSLLLRFLCLFTKVMYEATNW
ncbi:hypothetical protein DNTS_008195 [Danionella cerebrum]|uniref:Uncharacterized protein n=1 Tax=Danionella cerebrum TaxID=2873325 RepID=A0A553R5I9_9TELE|nr:hypothetical protein DNTS_008195 [Danionella translucida]